MTTVGITVLVYMVVQISQQQHLTCSLYPQVLNITTKTVYRNSTSTQPLTLQNELKMKER